MIESFDGARLSKKSSQSSGGLSGRSYNFTTWEDEPMFAFRIDGAVGVAEVVVFVAVIALCV